MALVKKIEELQNGNQETLEKLRAVCKNEKGNRLSDTGVDLVASFSEGGLTQTEIASFLDITPSAVSQLVAKLTTRGILSPK